MGTNRRDDPPMHEAGKLISRTHNGRKSNARFLTPSPYFLKSIAAMDCTLAPVTQERVPCFVQGREQPAPCNPPCGNSPPRGISIASSTCAAQNHLLPCHCYLFDRAAILEPWGLEELAHWPRHGCRQSWACLPATVLTPRNHAAQSHR